MLGKIVPSRWKIADFDKIDKKLEQKRRVREQKQNAKKFKKKKQDVSPNILNVKKAENPPDLTNISEINVDNVDHNDLPITATAENLARIKNWGNQQLIMLNTEETHHGRRAKAQMQDRLNLKIGEFNRIKRNINDMRQHGREIIGATVKDPDW